MKYQNNNIGMVGYKSTILYIQCKKNNNNTQLTPGFAMKMRFKNGGCLAHYPRICRILSINLTLKY